MKIVGEYKSFEIIKCKLGCINYHVKQTSDYCFGQGLIPICVREGTNCARGYTKVEMDKILEKERLEDELMKQSGLLLSMNT